MNCGAVGLLAEQAGVSPGGLVEIQHAGPWPQVSESAGLRTGICDKLPAGGPQLETGSLVRVSLWKLKVR